ncbi:Ig heavy chain V region 186-1 [Merluccius polli]|uniref:Ig heavy chain V region 186-1 n=1 Tax=Merluccius polli TaxID=89951 RepID=A0AA47MZU5_MERPO|nr:Ig heavy chain V region 186-1 [Merluccius polli]
MFSVAVLLLLLAAGSGVKCEQLTQPASLTIRPGQPLTIRCQVSYSVGSYYTAWIRQPDGSGLEWIGRIYTGGKKVKDSLSTPLRLTQRPCKDKTCSLETQLCITVPEMHSMRNCVKCEQLTQPASLTIRPGQPLTIRCQVSYSVSSYYTHWIRQPDGSGLEWIGYIYTGGKNVKDSLSSKFSLAVDSSSTPNTATLQGQNMQPGDSAVYYSVLLLLLAAGSGVKCEQLTQPASLTIRPGQPLTIRCQVSYSVSSYSTHWIRQPDGSGLEWIGYINTGGKKVKDSLSSKFSLAVDSSSTPNTATLQGQNMQPGDSAVYYSVLLLLLAAGSGVKCEQLTQPASLTIRPGQPLTIRCQVSYSVSSYYTHWIRQPDGSGLEWIGMIRTDGKRVKDSLSIRLTQLPCKDKTCSLETQLCITVPEMHNMRNSVLLLLLAAGSGVKCEQLTQPASLTIRPGQPLTIRCQVSYSVSSYWTGWIRQPDGSGLEWIGTIYAGDKYQKDSLSIRLTQLPCKDKTCSLETQLCITVPDMHSMRNSVLLLLLAAGSGVKCEQLTQPASLTIRPGQPLTLRCQVSYSVGSYSTNWIRQPDGSGLEWIGWIRTDGKRVKDSLSSKFSLAVDSSSTPNTATLQGQNMQPGDSAVYYSVLLLLLAAGSGVKCEQLTQPASLTIRPGQPLTIRCQVSYSVGSYYTAWIRQPDGSGLEWIGTIYTGDKYQKDSLSIRLTQRPCRDKTCSLETQLCITVPEMHSIRNCVKCEQLTQPASLTIRPGQPLTIRCQVSYSVSSYYTHWIRQPDGSGLEWIGRDTEVKDSLSSKFSLAVDSSSVKCEQLTQPASLTIRPGQPLTIRCQVSYSVSGYWTHWIRQPDGSGLEWIGWISTGGKKVKDSLSSKFSLAVDSSSVKCEQLTQPASLTIRPGQPLTIRCQVSYSVSSYWTGWIRQPDGSGLEWIGWIYTGDKKVKDSLSSKFSLTVDSSSVKCEQLTQPASLTIRPGQPLTIRCQVSYSVSSYSTHWIRQPDGSGLEWIGWIYTGGKKVKDSLSSKFSLAVDSSTSPNTATLQGQNMQPGDSAVYYCVKCEQLTQPASLTIRPGQPLTIRCQVSYSVSSYWTGWIRQPDGSGLEWIGWIYTGGKYQKDSLSIRLTQRPCKDKTCSLETQLCITVPEMHSIRNCVKCEQLTQPASLTIRPGQPLTIRCQVSYSVSSYSTHWIRQPDGSGLEWIGWIDTDGKKVKDSLSTPVRLTQRPCKDKTCSLETQLCITVPEMHSIRNWVKCEQLTQPASLTIRPGQPLTIRCQVSYSVSWIRQPDGSGLEWIGWIYTGDKKVKDSLSSKFSLAVDSSSVKCEQLTQPASLTIRPGQPLTIRCQVSYSVSSDWTHWIRQPDGSGLEWIGMIKTDGKYQKDSLSSKFSLAVDSSSTPNTATLQGQNMQPGDSAVYYSVLLLLLAAGSGVKCEQLTQPASLTIRPGQPLTIRCQVSYSVSSYSTNWIRQPDGSGLEWIGWISTGGKRVKDSLSSKFSLTVDSSSTPNTATLQGQNMQPGDSAVYYSVLLLLLAAGSGVKCEQLTQPASLTIRPGQPLTLRCQVSYSVSSYWTGWIRQPDGGGLEWIGGIYTEDKYQKDSLSSKFSLTVDSSSVKCEQLTQPASLTIRPGQPLTIRCQVSYSVSSYYTHWIRQPDGSGLEWIGWIRTDGKKVKDSLSSKFSLAVDSSSTPNTATLQGQNMQPGDSAVYYCVKCEQLTQPASLTIRPGQPLTIRCQVSYSVSWIRQPDGSGLEWIGYIYTGGKNVKDSLIRLTQRPCKDKTCSLETQLCITVPDMHSMRNSVLLLLLAAGSGVKCEQLTQPASLTIRPGQPLTIRCQVSYSVGSYYTGWIRQPDGSGLEWIGSIYTGSKYQKDSLSSKFSLAVDSSSTPNTALARTKHAAWRLSCVLLCQRCTALETVRKNEQKPFTHEVL